MNMNAYKLEYRRKLIFDDIGIMIITWLYLINRIPTIVISLHLSEISCASF